MRRFAFVLSLLMVSIGTAQALVPRATFSKPDQVQIRETDRWDLLVVKFAEGSEVRLRAGRLISHRGADLTGVDQILRELPATRVERLFFRPEAVYEQERQVAQARTKRQMADLNLYYAFGPADREQAEILLDRLNRLELVECVYPEPIPRLPVVEGDRIPPDYVEFQDYLEASPIGVNAYAAWAYEGGRGENVKMIDVELGWRWDHHDLPAPFFTGGTPDPSYFPHGTAVLGEIAGIDNEFGITGISPEVQVGGVAINISDYPSNLGGWFDMASTNLDPGDVWLIELHAAGPTGEYICMEWWQANYDAIAVSTGLGRICVQAAGNGGANLDAPIYEGKFDRTVRDSLAIIVGATLPTTMQPEDFTVYGSRVDCNGWGSSIVTTGYGDMYDDEGANYYYTAQFGGTSGASPMVVGVCCSAQSYYKGCTGEVLSPADLRAAIVDTGAPQPEPVTKHVGPRPNLEALFQHEAFQCEGVSLDRGLYRCQDSLGLRVQDAAASGSVVVQVTSTTEPAGETVILTEGEAGEFTGALTVDIVAPQPGDGILSVENGDFLLADYDPLDSQDEAGVDCELPVISSVQVAELGAETVQITWTTDEPADSGLLYGIGSPDQEAHDEDPVTEHSMELTGLDQCTQHVFHVQAVDVAGNLTLDNNQGAGYWFTTWERVTLLDEDMETDPGWEISGGTWAYGVPSGGGGEHGSPDPTSGFTGSSVTGYNLTGDYENSMPEYHLTTPSLDCSSAMDAHLEFARWLGVESPSFDHALLRISTDGGSSWGTIWENGGTMEGGSWELLDYDISTWADGQSDVRIRWTMGPTDTSWSYCGWNIDDVQVSYLMECIEVTPTPPPPTETPTPEPPTFTPIPTASPTATPEPSATPLPHPLGVRIEMPTLHLTPGDPFWVTGHLDNPGSARSQVPTFFVLGFGESYWFWPSWAHYDPPASVGVDSRELDIPSGSTPVQVIPSILWPDTGQESATGLWWYGAMLDETGLEILGQMASVEWSYGSR